MFIKDYSTLVHSILFSADHILLERERGKGGFISSVKLMEQYLQIARSMKGLMEMDSDGQKKNYNDYLEWQRMYDKAASCHLLLEDLVDYGFCDVPPQRDDNLILNALRKCLEDILGNEGADYNSDVDKLKSIWGQLIQPYTDVEEVFNKWLKVVLTVFEEFFAHFDDTNEGFNEAIVSTYYEYLEEHEEEIREELCGLLHEKKIFNSFSDDPTPEHYGELLKDELEQAGFNAWTRIIAEKYTYSKAIKIEKECFLNHLNKECKTESDVKLFLSTFAHIAILQELAKPSIKICRPQIKALPEVVSLTINDDIQMNNLFREIIKRLSSMVGGSFRKKWSHVKRVLEDEELMSKTNDTEFGRVMNKICPDINEENCRQSVKNNPVTPANADKGKKYSEWAVTKGKDECVAVAKEFAPLLALLHPKVSK